MYHLGQLPQMPTANTRRCQSHMSKILGQIGKPVSCRVKLPRRADYSVSPGAPRLAGARGG